MMKRRALIVAGTDTDAGKTLISAALLKQYSDENPDLHYWKPIQTGYPNDDDVRTVKSLSGSSRAISGLTFREPLSPHRAAELEGKEIDPSFLKAEYGRLHGLYDLIIEGAGGLLVPLTRTVLWLDLMASLELPVLLVARTGLGTINHTLLSLESLSSRNLQVTAIAFCGPSNPDTVKTISQFSGIPSLAPLEYADSEKELPRVDPDGLLRPYLCSMS